MNAAQVLEFLADYHQKILDGGNSWVFLKFEGITTLNEISKNLRLIQLVIGREPGVEVFVGKDSKVTVEFSIFVPEVEEKIELKIELKQTSIFGQVFHHNANITHITVGNCGEVHGHYSRPTWHFNEEVLSRYWKSDSEVDYLGKLEVPSDHRTPLGIYSFVYISCFDVETGKILEYPHLIKPQVPIYPTEIEGEVHSFWIPNGFDYIAVDGSGQTWAFKTEPKFFDGVKGWMNPNTSVSDDGSVFVKTVSKFKNPEKLVFFVGGDYGTD